MNKILAAVSLALRLWELWQKRQERKQTDCDPPNQPKDR
jgi:hypothetical protein